MGRRSEQRIAISFPVIVRGKDSRGTAFAVTTETSDISFSGAAIKGVNNLVQPGMKIEVECRDQRAWYRVQWVGKDGNSMSARAGAKCLEIGKYIWGVPPKEWEADMYDPSQPRVVAPSPDATASAYSAPGSWNGADRRQFARHACRIETQVIVENDSIEMPGKITDISLGGCYVEMLSPLPVDTPIELSLSPGDITLRLSGKVRSSQTGLGMGVSFTGMGPGDFEKLRKFAPPTIEAPEAAKQAPSRPAPPRANPRSQVPSAATIDLSTTAESLDALVRLLLRKQIFTPGELTEELEKAKIVRA
jgi:PilZ domain